MELLLASSFVVNVFLSFVISSLSLLYPSTGLLFSSALVVWSEWLFYLGRVLKASRVRTTLKLYVFYSLLIILPEYMHHVCDPLKETKVIVMFVLVCILLQEKEKRQGVGMSPFIEIYWLWLLYRIDIIPSNIYFFFIHIFCSRY